MYIYIFKSGKIKLKYSCNSEFHAKAIIRNVISFLSKNKQKYLLYLEKKYKIQKRIKLRFTVFSLHVLIRTFLIQDFLFNMLLSLM